MGDLVLRTLLFGTITALVGWRVNRIWISAATLFWVSWMFLVSSAWLCVAFDLMGDIPDRSFELIEKAYWGAFAGGLVGILLAGRARKKIQDTPVWNRFIIASQWLLDRILVPYVVLMLVLGTAHLIQRWAPVDFDIYRIGEVRQVVVGVEWPWIARLANYVASLGIMLAVLLGTVDAASRPSLGKLFWIWFASAPHGIAFGGRGWTLAPLLVYCFSFLLSRNCCRQPPPFRRFLPVGALALLGLWTFTILGTIRTREPSDDRNADLSVGSWDIHQRLMAAEWVGVSMISVAIHGDYTATLAPSWGSLTFGYIAVKAADFGMARPPAEDWDSWRINDLPSEENGFTWCVPPTAIPYLIYDYGESGMPIAMGVLIALLQWLSVRWVGQGLFRHITAFLAFYAAHNTIGTLVVITPLTVLPMFFAGVGEVFVQMAWPRIFKSMRRLPMSAPLPALAGPLALEPRPAAEAAPAMPPLGTPPAQDPT